MLVIRKTRRCRWLRCIVLLILFLCVVLVVYVRGEHLILPDLHAVNRYISVTVQPGFEIKPPFSFPQPDGIRTVDQLSSKQWIHELTSFLHKNRHHKIYLLASDIYSYPSLLNWLVAMYVNTEIDLKDILILSLDERLYQILRERDISTIYIKNDEFILYHYFLSWRRDKLTFDLMTRLSVARLISHWGFDVVVFDVDAILLKDPEGIYKVFSDSDIISSHSLREIGTASGKWTMSLGFALIRSNRMVEYLWEYTSNTTEKRWHDQQKLNNVINVHFEAKWSLDSRRTQRCKQHMSHLCDVTGVTKTGLKVTLLSRWAVCRYCGISRIEDYYIWHKESKSISQVDRRKAAEVGSVWFLRDDWKKVDKRSTATRQNWIHELTDSM